MFLTMFGARRNFEAGLALVKDRAFTRAVALGI